MKNLQRKKSIEISQSANVNKYRFKMHVDNPVKDDKPTNFDLTCQLIDLEQDMMKTHRIKETLKISN